MRLRMGLREERAKREVKDSRLVHLGIIRGCKENSRTCVLGYQGEIGEILEGNKR